MMQSWRSFLSLLRESLIWSDGDPIAPSRIFLSILSFAGPLLLGLYLHNIALGTNMAIAGYLVGTDVLPDSITAKARSLFIDVFSLSLATGLGAALVPETLLTKTLFLLIVAVASLFGSLSPMIARLSSLFIIMVIIARSLGMRGADPLAATGAFLLGSAWIVALIFFLQTPLERCLPQRWRSRPNGGTQQSPSTKQLWHHWISSLQHLSGWLYTLRLMVSMVIAELWLYFYPNPHSYWISITIVIVLSRNPREALLKKIQRSIGTILGVVLASTMLIWTPPLWFAVAMILILTAGRPILKARNYAAYSLLMTLFVMLLFDLYQPPTAAILLERVQATLMGILIAFTVGYYVWRKVL